MTLDVSTSPADALLAPFDANRFRSAVPFYLEHRLRYPRELIDYTARAFDVSRHDRVLDLGCGPGFLAIDFALLAGEVIGVDPDEAMLAPAPEAAKAAGVSVNFRLGSSYDLPGDFGRFKLVVMGRSFHWMDRKATLDALNGMIEPGGGIALFTDDHEKTPANRWHDELRNVLNDYASADSYTNAIRAKPEWPSHAEVLLDSPFCILRRHSLIRRLPISMDQIIGRALSMSGTAPEKLGERRAEFEAAIRARLAPLAKQGRFEEIVGFEALIATRE